MPGFPAMLAAFAVAFATPVIAATPATVSSAPAVTDTAPAVSTQFTLDGFRSAKFGMTQDKVRFRK